MAKLDRVLNIVTYSEEDSKLGIPSLDSRDAIAYRLHLILSNLGEEVFNEVFEVFQSNDGEFQKYNLKMFQISEFDIWISYLGLVSNIMGQSVRKTGFHDVVKDIFPLQNTIDNTSLNIGSRDRYPYIKELKAFHVGANVVRSKLAIFELLYSKFKDFKYIRELSSFYSGYDESFKNNSSIYEYSETFQDKVLIFNYTNLMNEVRCCDSESDIIEFCEKYSFEVSRLNELPEGKDLVLEILFSKSLVSDIGIRALEKRLKKVRDTYFIESKIGRPSKCEDTFFTSNSLTGGASFIFEIINFCRDVNKFNLIKSRNLHIPVFNCRDVELSIEFELPYMNRILKLID